MIKDFIFDGQKLSSFGYIICDFNNSNEITTSNTSDISFTDIKSPLSNISHVVSTSYTDNLSNTIQIIKNPCNFQKLDVMNDDLSELTKWLCRKNYKLFKWIDDEDDDEIFYEVRINLKKIELCNKCIGFELDILANRPFGFTREFNYKKELLANTSINITVYSDDEGYIYPDLLITIQEDGDLKLLNNFEDRTTYIAQCKAGEIITITGGDILQITSNDETHDLSQCFNYKFLRLCSKYKNNTNIISSNLACNIDMKYRGIRKVGI